MPVEQQPIPSANLSFIFEPHAATPAEAPGITQRYKEFMLDFFRPGDLNILLLEKVNSGLDTDSNKMNGPIFPRSAVDQYLRFYEEEYIAFHGNDGINLSRSAARRAINRGVESGQDSLTPYSTAILRAVDQVNNRGYKVGFLYEKSEQEPEEVTAFFEGKRPPSDPAEFRIQLTQSMNTALERDRSVIRQLEEVIKQAGNRSVNVLIPRGMIHNSIVNMLPDSLKNKVVFAVVNDQDFAASNPIAKIGLRYVNGATLTDEDWNIAYEESLRT